MVLTAQKCFYFKTRKTKREHLDKWQIKNTTIRRDVMLSLGCLARSHWVFFIFFKEALVDEWAKMGVGVKWAKELILKVGKMRWKSWVFTSVHIRTFSKLKGEGDPRSGILLMSEWWGLLCLRLPLVLVPILVVLLVLWHLCWDPLLCMCQSLQALLCLWKSVSISSGVCFLLHDGSKCRVVEGWESCWCCESVSYFIAYAYTTKKVRVGRAHTTKCKENAYSVDAVEEQCRPTLGSTCWWGWASHWPWSWEPWWHPGPTVTLDWRCSTCSLDQWRWCIGLNEYCIHIHDRLWVYFADREPVEGAIKSNTLLHTCTQWNIPLCCAWGCEEESDWKSIDCKDREEWLAWVLWIWHTNSWGRQCSLANHWHWGISSLADKKKEVLWDRIVIMYAITLCMQVVKWKCHNCGHKSSCTRTR